MLRFVGTRLLKALSVLLGTSILTFLIGHMTGDPVMLMARENATHAQKLALAHSLGLDIPVLDQYLSYIIGALHGDLGISYRQHLPVSHLIALRLPNTLELAAVAFMLAILVSFPLGTLAALKRDTWVDYAITAFSMIGQVVPGFWLGLILVIVVAVTWRLLPVAGSGTPAHLVLPALTLALPTMGRMTRLVRAGMLDVLSSDYIRTARAKGLTQGTILFVHAARNAAIPLVTQAGLELGDMIGSAFIIETVFAWPGIGRMTILGVEQRDFLVVQGCVLVIATGFVLINLAVDMLYAAIDPRVAAQ